MHSFGWCFIQQLGKIDKRQSYQGENSRIWKYGIDSKFKVVFLINFNLINFSKYYKLFYVLLHSFFTSLQILYKFIHNLKNDSKLRTISHG